MYGIYKVVYGDNLQYSACFTYDDYNSKVSAYDSADNFYNGVNNRKRFLHTSTDIICEDE